MKKMFLLVIALMTMSFASNSLFAQNVNTSGENQNPTDLVVSDVSESEDASDLSETPIADSTVSDGTPAEETVSFSGRSISAEDLQALIAVLNNQTGNEKRNVLPAENNIFVPLNKKGKFTGHHVCQRLELSVLGGKDKSAQDYALSEMGIDQSKSEGIEKAGSDQEFTDNLIDKTSGFNIGANFGYSVVFVPGYQEDNQLLLNRFGFAYSAGIIFQFDNDKKSGVTCDFLGKVGIETGFNKAIGVGVDFLFGGGKTAQAVIDFSDVNFDDPDVDDLVITQENLWCAKAGTQLWLRLNFLTKSVKNFDTAVFTRFVYSFQPYSEDEKNDRIISYDEIPFWQNEAWSFGVTMTYFF